MEIKLRKTNKQGFFWGGGGGVPHALIKVIEGMLSQKALGHGSSQSLNSHWLRVSCPLRPPYGLGIHENNFGLQHIIFLMDEESSYNTNAPFVWLLFIYDGWKNYIEFTWQIWIILARSEGRIFKTTLESRHVQNMWWNLGLL